MLSWSAAVRYAECDQQGVVFNGHYLTWCDEATTAWLGKQGFAYADLLTRGLDVVVVSASLSWSRPARWGDVVEVHTSPERVGRTSFVVRHEVRVQDEVCCEVTLTYVMTGEDTSPVPVPDELRELFPR